jgi:capsular polysaccharide biosynthesis protein
VAQSEQQLIATHRGTVKRGRVFALRMAESFFRRWPLYVLPIVLFAGLGALKAKDIPKTYLSVGSVNVSSSTFLSDLTSVRTPDVGYETPATKTARDINERMGSDAFAKQVGVTAGLGTALSTGQVTLDYVRTHVSAAAAGDTLLRVSSTTDSAEQSQRLAAALISSYTAYVISVTVASSNAVTLFYQEQIKKDNATLTTAQADLIDWTKANKVPPSGRSEADEITLKGLQDAVTTAQTAVASDQSNLDQASLQVRSAQADIGQRLSIADQPTVPNGPQPTRMKQAFTLAIFGLLGLLVVSVALILAGLLDHAVRSPEDISEACGLEVVATIPVRKKAARTSGARKSAELTAGAA